MEITVLDQQIQIRREMHRAGLAMFGDKLQDELEQIAATAEGDVLAEVVMKGIYKEAQKRQLPGWRNLAF